LPKGAQQEKQELDLVVFDIIISWARENLLGGIEKFA